MDREQVDVSVKRPRCPFCRDDVYPTQAKVACDGCMGWHHVSCWEDHGKCAACGHFATTAANLPRKAAPAPSLPKSRQGLAYGLGMAAGLLLRHFKSVAVWLAILTIALIALVAFMS